MLEGREERVQTYVVSSFEWLNRLNKKIVRQECAPLGRILRRTRSGVTLGIDRFVRSPWWALRGRIEIKGCRSRSSDGRVSIRDEDVLHTGFSNRIF